MFDLVYVVNMHIKINHQGQLRDLGKLSKYNKK